MTIRLKRLLLLVLITLVPTLLLWAPFFFRLTSLWNIPLPQDGMATIVANYDGPLFIVVAKTLYALEQLKGFQFPLPVEYYAAHFPLFPLLIKSFAIFLGFPYSMLFVTVISSFLAVYFFYKLSREYLKPSNALWLAFVFSILPARFLIVRSVGSPEPLFIAAVIASIYYFRKEKYFAAGVWGALAQLTKSPGILLFIAYLAIVAWPKIGKLATQSVATWVRSLNLKKIYPLVFIPASLLLLFVFYQLRFGDFLAYFHSGDNLHLFFPPFSIFNYAAPWVGTFWLEEIIFVYLIAALGLGQLISQKEQTLAWFVGIFLLSLIFVSHRDVIRYALPIAPFIILSFRATLVKPQFKIIILALLIPIYLYSLAYISQNVMPISNWSPLL
jgi:hypothetical protein